MTPAQAEKWKSETETLDAEKSRAEYRETWIDQTEILVSSVEFSIIIDGSGIHEGIVPRDGAVNNHRASYGRDPIDVIKNRVID